MDEVREPISKMGKLVVAMMLAMLVLAGAALFRPQKPSAFSAGSGYGTGHGNSSLMFGASPQKGAAR